MAENEEDKRASLVKVKDESEKAGLKLNIQKTKIMASGPITSWQIDGETVETVKHFIFLGSKITADGDCSHEIKRRLLLERKVMTNLDSILKSRDITLLLYKYSILTIVPQLYSRSPKLIHLRLTITFYLLDSNFPFHILSNPWHSSLCFFECDYFRYFL